MSFKILITGSSGFIGSHLVEESLEKGLKVFAGIRKTSSKQYLTDSRIQIVELDFENPDNIGDILEQYQFDYIVHNAGTTNVKKKSTYRKVNALYLKILLEQIVERQILLKKIIFISSLAAYGPAEQQINNIIDLQSLPMPLSAYGQSKLEAEEILSTFKSEIPFIIFRPTVVYGPRETNFYNLIKMINMGLEVIVGKQDGKLTFIYVKDLVRLIISALEFPLKNKGYFVGDGASFAPEEVTTIIKSIVNKSTVKIRIPMTILWGISWILEKTSWITGKYPIFNREKYLEIKCQSWVLDCAPIKEDFNFVPRYSLTDGLKETISWYQKHNWL